MGMVLAMVMLVVGGWWLVVGGWCHTSPCIPHTLHLESEAHSVHNLWSRFIIIVLRNPHFLERRQRGQDAASNPHRVLPLWWCHHFDLDRCRSQCSDFLAQTGINVREHRGSSRKYSVLIQITSNVHIALHDRFISHFVDSFRFSTHQARFEQNLRASESLSSDGNHLTIG